MLSSLLLIGRMKGVLGSGIGLIPQYEKDSSWLQKAWLGTRRSRQVYEL